MMQSFRQLPSDMRIPEVNPKPAPPGAVRHSRPRVLLADDHKMFAETLRDFLAAEFDVVGVVENGLDLLSAADKLKPEVVVADLGMPLLNGLDAGGRLKERNPSTKIVYVTQNREPEVVAEAFRKGASAFVVKSSAISELMEAIREALQGRNYLSPAIPVPGAQSIDEDRGTSADPALTARQREVVQLLAEGKSIKEIAAILKISPRTAQFHKYEAMSVLHVKTNAAVVQYALKHRIIWP